MTYKQIRKALQGRYELLNDDECNIWGDYEDLDEDGVHAYDLVQLVEVHGVLCAVPVGFGDLTSYQCDAVTETCERLARDRAEYEGDERDL